MGHSPSSERITMDRDCSFSTFWLLLTALLAYWHSKPQGFKQSENQPVAQLMFGGREGGGQTNIDRVYTDRNAVSIYVKNYIKIDKLSDVIWYTGIISFVCKFQCVCMYFQYAWWWLKTCGICNYIFTCPLRVSDMSINIIIIFECIPPKIFKFHTPKSTNSNFNNFNL
jgi:hypothetical protein